MNIGIGRIAEASAPYREKAKESTTATAIQAAAQEVLAQNPPESAEKIGVIGAYAQGPADIQRRKALRTRHPWYASAESHSLHSL